MKLYELNLKINKPEVKKSRGKKPDTLPKFTIQLTCHFMFDAEEQELGVYMAPLGRRFHKVTFDKIKVETNNLPAGTYHSVVICPEDMVQDMAYSMRLECYKAIKATRTQLAIMSAGVTEMDMADIFYKTIIKRDVV